MVRSCRYRNLLQLVGLRFATEGRDVFIIYDVNDQKPASQQIRFSRLLKNRRHPPPRPLLFPHRDWDVEIHAGTDAHEVQNEQTGARIGKEAAEAADRAENQVEGPGRAGAGADFPEERKPEFREGAVQHGRDVRHILRKSIVLVLIAIMHDIFHFRDKTALQILFLMLRKFVMQFMLVRYFCISYATLFQAIEQLEPGFVENEENGDLVADFKVMKTDYPVAAVGSGIALSQVLLEEAVKRGKELLLEV